MVAYIIIIRDVNLFKRRINLFGRDEKQVAKRVQAMYPTFKIVAINKK